MGTKAHPGRFDCYAKAEPDEPLFVLLGRDRLAPNLVDMWAMARLKMNEPIEVVQEAADCAAAMRNWLYLSKKREARALEFVPTETLVNEIARRNAFERLAAMSSVTSDFAPSQPIELSPPIGEWPEGARANGNHFVTPHVPADETDPEGDDGTD